MSESLADRTAKWLVADRLSCVLHIGDSTLAYQLAGQGHELTVLDPDVSNVHNDDIGYVCGSVERLPFAANSFDAIVTARLHETPSVLAEYARVLGPEGLLSTLDQSYDDSIPWLRKLYEIIGRPESGSVTPDTLRASDLFHEPEQRTAGSWHDLDLDALMRFARAALPADRAEESLHEVRKLWDSYGARTGSLRLRRQITCLRAQVNKAALPEQAEPRDVTLFDFH